MSLQALGRAGVRLLGTLEGLDEQTLTISGDLLDHLALGDMVVTKLRGAIDGYVSKSKMKAPPASEDPADFPCEGLEEMANMRRVHLKEAGISTVIWATGFGGNFSYLDPELLNESGLPRHEGGICPSPGLYFLGLNWLRTRWSGLIAGARKDAEVIADQISPRESEQEVTDATA